MGYIALRPDVFAPQCRSLHAVESYLTQIAICAEERCEVVGNRFSNGCVEAPFTFCAIRYVPKSDPCIGQELQFFRISLSDWLLERCR